MISRTFLCWNSSRNITISRLFISLTNDKILDVTKLKAIADDKLNVAKLTVSLFYREEYNLQNREKRRWLPVSFPFTIVFSGAFFFRVVKRKDCVPKNCAISCFKVVK